MLLGQKHVPNGTLLELLACTQSCQEYLYQGNQHIVQIRACIGAGVERGFNSMNVTLKKVRSHLWITYQDLMADIRNKLTERSANYSTGETQPISVWP